MKFMEWFLGNDSEIQEGKKSKKSRSPEKIVSDHILFNRFKLPVSDKLKLIRSTYGLHAQSVSNIIGIDYRNYQNYENGKVTPTANALERVSEYLGINGGWLLGTSDAIYTEDAILTLENIYLSTDRANNKHVFAIPDKLGALQIYPISNGYLDEKYYDLEKRRKFYTLKQRSNIIFCINEYISYCLAKGCFGADDDGNLYFNWVKAIEARVPYLSMLNQMVYIEGNSEALNQLILSFEPFYDLEAELNKLPAVVPKEELIKGAD